MVRRRTRLIAAPVAIAETAGEGRGFIGPGFAAAMEADEGPAWGQVILNGPALALIFEGALGGAGDGPARPLNAELTLAQRSLANRIVRSLAQDFVAALTEEASLTLQVTSLQALPSDEPLVFSGSDGLVVDCTFEGVEGDACITIAVSAEALEAATREQVVDDTSHGDPRLTEALQNVEVEVVAELGRVKMGLREVLSVCVGQVIRLTTALDDPVTVRIGGIPKLTGVPVVSRGQLAIDVRGRIDS